MSESSSHSGSGSRRRGPLSTGWLYLAIVVVGIAYALPLVWMAGVATKPAAEASGVSLSPLPRFDGGSGGYFSNLWASILSNFDQVWNSPQADFPTYFRNTVLVGILSVAGMTLSSAIAAYGFSRVKWPGRDAVFTLVLLTLMIPQAVLMSPQFLLFKHLGMIGTLMPLWLPSWFAGAFSVFLLRQFFLSIPAELDEAARMDGCSHFGIFFWIMLPLCRPALAVVALMQSVAVWNDFLGPLLFLNRDEQYTLSLGLQMYQSQHGGTPWNLVMMASCIVVMPVLALYLLTRRLFVEGVATQGAKEG
jgi:multiple sugar transport system permease protein